MRCWLLGDVKLVQLREMTLKERTGQIELVSSVGERGGAGRRKEKAERSRRWRGQGRASCTSCLSASLLLAGSKKDTDGGVWVLGCPCACWGGGRDGGQCVLESWGFPALRFTEAAFSSLPPVHHQDAGPQPCGWHAFCQSERCSPCSLLFKELLGSGEGDTNPLLQQLVMGFPFLLQKFPRNDGCLPPSPLCFYMLSQLSLEQIT